VLDALGRGAIVELRAEGRAEGSTQRNRREFLFPGPLHNMTNGKQSVKHAPPSWQEYTLFVTVRPGKLDDHSSRLVDARGEEASRGGVGEGWGIGMGIGIPRLGKPTARRPG